MEKKKRLQYACALIKGIYNEKMDYFIPLCRANLGEVDCCENCSEYDGSCKGCIYIDTDVCTDCINKK